MNEDTQLALPEDLGSEVGVLDELSDLRLQVRLRRHVTCSLFSKFGNSRSRSLEICMSCCVLRRICLECGDLCF